MKRKLSFVLAFVAALVSGSLWAQQPQTQVIPYGPNIVRVLKGEDHSSYSVVRKAEQSDAPSFSWKVDDKGRVTFYAPDGSVLLSEKDCTVKAITEGVDKGRVEVAQTWTLAPDEAIFGLGQRRDESMNQRGQSFRLWNTNTHIYIPYFTSQKGYGLYWDNAGETWFEDHKDQGADYGTTFRSSVATGIDYYFIYRDGTQDGVMAGVRELSGQATMFPLWTLGFWQCRERYRTPDELTSVIDEYRKRQIPLDGIVQDWQYWGCDSNWNSMRFENPHYLNKIGDPKQMRFLPNDENPQAEIEKFRAMTNIRFETPQQMIDYAHEQNTHLMITIWPDFGPWTKQYAELKKINALYPFKTWPQNRGVLVYDPFNPKARDIYWKHLSNLYRMGIDAWWTDSTEPDHFEEDGDNDFLTHDGSWRSVKNAFSLVTNRGIYDHQRATKGNQKRSFQMTRSGAFGIQHYGTFSWSGDIGSSWEEMKNQIPSGLNYSLCGIPMWNTDLGGFFCWDYNNNPRDPWAQEINVRWMQWGTFMPLMRSHCSSPMVSEIYKYGEPGDWAYDAMVETVNLRYRLMPYIYSTLGACVQHSEIMMRPFVMDFPNDKKAINLNDSYMFGRSLLVKPVTDPLYTWQGDGRRGHEIYAGVKGAAAPVKVYLPSGSRWYNFWTNEVLDGGREHKVLAPINQIPVFVRQGSIVPFGPKVQFTSEKAWDNLEVRVYPGANATFILYEDEGDGYNYEQGQFSEIQFNWNDADRTLTIGARSGNFKGMLAQRQFNIVIVGRDTASGSAPAQGKAVSYDGQETTVRF